MHAARESLDRKNLLKFCLVVGLVLGLMTHGFMFVNKLPNHDDLNHYMNLRTPNGDAGLGAGRYFMFLFWKLFADLSTPWLNGVLGVIFTSLSAFWLCDAFDLRQRWQAVIAAVVLQTYPTSASMYGYMYQAHVMMLGVMFACMAPWLARHGGKLRLAGAALAMWLATGVYQSNVMLAIGLLILLVMQKTMRGGVPVRQLWLEAIGYAAAAIAAVVVYLLVFSLYRNRPGVQLTALQEYNELGHMSLGLIPARVLEAYQNLWVTYFGKGPAHANGCMRLIRAALAAMGFLGVAVSGIGCLRRKQWAQAALLALCALLLPLACSGILFMGDLILAHDITYYPMIVIPLLWLTTLPGWRAERVRRGAALAAAAVYLGYGFTNVMIINQAYMYHYLNFARVEHYAQRMAMRIEALEDYAPGIPLKMIGHADEAAFFKEPELDERFSQFVGMYDATQYISWEFSTTNLLNVAIGLPVTDARDWEPDTPEAQQQIDEMPVYPAQGSIAVVDGVCVVKLR